MLASIPAVAVAKSVFVYYFEKQTGRRLVAEDGVFFKGTPSVNEDVTRVGRHIADATSPASRRWSTELFGRKLPKLRVAGPRRRRRASRMIRANSGARALIIMLQLAFVE